MLAIVVDRRPRRIIILIIIVSLHRAVARPIDICDADVLTRSLWADVGE